MPVQRNLRITPVVLNLSNPGSTITAHFRHATGHITDVPITLLPLGGTADPIKNEQFVKKCSIMEIKGCQECRGYQPEK